MNLPDILNVALGIIALYLLLSSIASLLLELATGAAQYREEILYITINRLLAGVPDAPWNLTRLVMDRIGRRLPTDFDLFGIVRYLRGRWVKDYQVVAPGLVAGAVGKEDIVQRFWKHPKIRSLAAPGAEAPPSMEASTFASVVIDIAIPRDAQRVLPNNRLKLLRALAAPNEDTPVVLLQTLRTLGLSSEIPAGATGEALWTPFRANIAAWYNEASARATDFYRGTMRRLLLGLGFILALLLNADTVRIIHLLSHDRPLRESVAAYSETLVAEHNAVTAAQLSGTAVATEQTSELQKTRVALGQDIERLRQLEELGFPIGWNGPDHGFHLPSGLSASAYSSWLWPWLACLIVFLVAIFLKLVGLGVTALAVSLGAPFWYGVMNRLIGLKKGQSDPAPPAAAGGSATSVGGGGSAGPAVAAQTMPLEIGYDLAAPATGYCARKAYWLARASAAVYSPEREILSLVQDTWKFHDCYYFDEGSTQGFCAFDHEIVLLVFRGTELEQLNDLLIDVNSQLTELKAADYWEAPVRKVHEGFQTALDYVWADLYAKILAWSAPRSGQAARQIYITGHSLGGALATLAFARLAADSTRPVPTLYTFGCPKVGNSIFARELDRLHPERIFRYVNETDIVPQFPPLPDYHQVGMELGFDGAGKLRTKISGLNRLLGYAAGAAVSIKTAAHKAVDDHSMVHYVDRCERLVPPG